MKDSSESTLRDMLCLLLVPGLGPVRLNRLLKTFGNPEAVLRAGFDELKAVSGIGEAVCIALAGKNWDDREVDRQLDMIGKVRAKPVYLWEKEYPAYLTQIYDPPPVLFIRGDPDCLNRPCLAIVGTRGPSLYGSEMARSLGSCLSGAGFTIVSGLARGIDSMAHKAALDAGGLTAAVLGSGVDVIYPCENMKLAEKIIESGALLSEYPMGTPPEAFNFPRRNRVISGLSRGVLVVEAGLKSGALITATYAADQNREVFAVPGDVARNLSHGTNMLIQKGAKLVQSVEDVLEEMGELVTMLARAGSPPKGAETAYKLSQEERLVFEGLSREPLHVDDLAQKLKMDVSRLLAVLLRLEMKQLVRQHPGKLYSLG